MSVVDGSFGHPLELEENASMPLAGGIMQYGYQCGMVWGAALAAGAEAYRLFGPGPQAQAKAIVAGGRIVQSFRACNQSENCAEITGIDKSSSVVQMMTFFFLKAGMIRCFRMAARYAPIAASQIDAALSEEQLQAPSPPVSCAAVLAEKMGASDMHALMAAGLAGGIGLSGGGCGALGAAIWIIGLDWGRKGDAKIGYKHPRALAAMDRFVKCTDSVFECSRIVGRSFGGVDDHAAYLRAGGCSELIEALATV